MTKKILVAIDLAEEPAQAVLRRLQEVRDPGDEVDVLHVVEAQYVQYSFDPTFVGGMVERLEQAALEAASARLAELCAGHDIDAEHQHVSLGRAASTIRDEAGANSVDLIVMGSHGAHGWRRLLGSTASGVLHGTPTNVLICRLEEQSTGALS